MEISFHGFYNPRLILEIIRIFGCSFYGSPLWSLGSEEHQKLNRSWNTVMKMVWDLPYATHNRFLESMSDIPHLQSMLHGRYIGFIDNLSSTKKPHLQILFILCKQDQSCNTGQNIEYLLTSFQEKSLKALIVKKPFIKTKRIYPSREDEEWKIQMIEEMCLSKLGFMETNIEEKDITIMLELICTEWFIYWVVASCHVTLLLTSLALECFMILVTSPPVHNFILPYDP